MSFSIIRRRVPRATPCQPVQAGERELFVRRLAETIEWCARRASLYNSSGCLRTLELHPTNLRIQANGHLDYDWKNLSHVNDVLDELARRRAEGLKTVGEYPDELRKDLGRGRLLLCEPECALHGGLAENETGGFIDTTEVPPWDTWLWALEGPQNTGPVLISWVPPHFISAVEQGILVDPVDCISWVTNCTMKHPILDLCKRLENQLEFLETLDAPH